MFCHLSMYPLALGLKSGALTAIVINSWVEHCTENRTTLVDWFKSLPVTEGSDILILQLLWCFGAEFHLFCRTNRTLYGPVSLKPLPHNYKPCPLPLPRSGALEDDKDILGAETDEEDIKEEGDTGEEFEQCSESSSEPLMEGLVTLSTLPKSHWASLPNLEVIKVGTRLEGRGSSLPPPCISHVITSCVYVMRFAWGFALDDQSETERCVTVICFCVCLYFAAKEQAQGATKGTTSCSILPTNQARPGPQLCSCSRGHTSIGGGGEKGEGLDQPLCLSPLTFLLSPYRRLHHQEFYTLAAALHCQTFNSA